MSSSNDKPVVPSPQPVYRGPTKDGFNKGTPSQRPTTPPQQKR